MKSKLSRGDGKKRKEVENSFSFAKTLPKLIDEEVSPLAKLLLQENLLSFEIILFIYSVADALTHGMLNQFGKENRLDRDFIPVVIPRDTKLERMTLGQLIEFARTFFEPTALLVAEMEFYVKRRNKLTHNLLRKYSIIKEVQKEAHELVTIGQVITEKLRKFQKSATWNAAVFSGMEEFLNDQYKKK